jgi:hypothetical protein
MFGFGGGRPIKGQGPDITAKHSSGELVTAMLALVRGKRQPMCVPGAGVSSIKVGNGKQITASSPQFPKAEALWKDLLACYSPLSLKGNVRCSLKDVQEQLGQTSQYLEANLARPADFKAVVVPPNTNWPPDYYDTSGAYETIKYDRVYALAVPLQGGYSGNLTRLVRFAFVDSRTDGCLLTDPVDPRKQVREPSGRQPAVYGPDLFAEVVGAVRMP